MGDLHQKSAIVTAVSLTAMTKQTKKQNKTQLGEKILARNWHDSRKKEKSSLLPFVMTQSFQFHKAK